MVPEAMGAVTTSAVPSRALAELGEVALGPMLGQALLPVKYTSKPPLSFHLPQHPRPAQPILPGSFWSSPASFPTLPSAHRGVGLKRSPKHTTPCINPSTASCCSWTKTQAPSVAHNGPRQTLQFHPSSLVPAPPHWPHFCSLDAPAVPGTWRPLPTEHPWLVPPVLVFIVKVAIREQDGLFLSPPFSLFIYFPALFYLFSHQLFAEHVLCSRHCPGTGVNDTDRSPRSLAAPFRVGRQTLNHKYVNT